MAYDYNYPNSVQVETTNIWEDAALIESVDVSAPAFKNLLVRLYQNINIISNALNLKETGYYDNTREFIISSQYFPNPISPSVSDLNLTNSNLRPIFRTTVIMGALPNPGVNPTITVPHNISPNSAFKVTRIYGSATLPSDVAATLRFIPIPYSSPTLNQNIQLYADGTNVYITTAIDYSAYTECVVVIEYIKY